MGIKTKTVLAATFVGVVAFAATAFGQAGSAPDDQSTPKRDRAEARQRDPNRCGPDGVRHRRPDRLVHSETKYQLREGFGTRVIDQGTITAIDHAAKKITIKRADGESVSATATDDTRVCKDGQRAAFDALKVGDHARLIQGRGPERSGLLGIAARTPGSEERPSPESRPNVPERSRASRDASVPAGASA